MVNQFMTKKSRIYNGKWIDCSINCVDITGLPHEKEWNWTSVLYHTQKSTLNGLQIWMQNLKPKNS